MEYKGIVFFDYDGTLTDENENTLKRFYPEPEKNQVRLKAENPKYKDIITRECHVQGVAVKVIKDLI